MSATLAGACPSWCWNDPASCDGDHCCADGPWMSVPITPHAEGFDRSTLEVRPSWSEVDGLPPTVVLFVGDWRPPFRSVGLRVQDFQVDLDIAQARELIEHIASTIRLLEAG